MERTYIPLIGAALVLLAPFLNSVGFPWNFLDLFIVRLLALALILWSITQGAMPGIFTALGVLALYFERNRNRLATTLPANTPSTYLVKGSPVPPLAPSHTEYDYAPTTDSGVSVEELEQAGHPELEEVYETAPEASGLDHKVVLEAAPRSEDAVAFFERHGVA